MVGRKKSHLHNLTSVVTLRLLPGELRKSGRSLKDISVDVRCPADACQMRGIIGSEVSFPSLESVYYDWVG